MKKTALLSIVALSLGLAAALPASAGFSTKDLVTFDGPGFGPKDLTTFDGPGFGPKDLTTFDGPGFGPADIRSFDGPGQKFEPHESR